MPDNVHFILSADQKEALRLTLGEKSGVVAGRNFSDAVYFQNTEFMIYVFLLDGPMGWPEAVGWVGEREGAGDASRTTRNAS